MTSESISVADAPKCKVSDSEAILRVSNNVTDDMTDMQISSFATRNVNNESDREVHFGEVEIREYGYTLGDHPDCSKGPPLTLDWHFNPAGIYKVDEYEGNHQHRRNLRQMLISYNKRFEILQMGIPPVSMTEIKSVEKEMDRIKNQRQRTRAFLPYQKFEEVIQSTGRKVKRVTSNGNSSSQSSYS